MTKLAASLPSGEEDLRAAFGRIDPDTGEILGGES